MAAISKQQFRELLESAYEAGYHGSLELKQSYAEDTLANLGIKDTKEVKEEGRIYTLAELQRLPIDTIINHPLCGLGTVRKNGMETYVEWDSGKIAHFYNDGKPWNLPIKIEKRS